MIYLWVRGPFIYKTRGNTQLKKNKHDSIRRQWQDSIASIRLVRRNGKIITKGVEWDHKKSYGCKDRLEIFKLVFAKVEGHQSFVQDLRPTVGHSEN
jgi:hypothetical protein